MAMIEALDYVFALGSRQSEYVVKRDGFRVELLPLKPTTVFIRRVPKFYTVPAPQ